MADKIQADFEQLGNLANQVDKVADDWEKWYSKISSQTEVLARSWTGRGASAFQKEMDEIVLPALKRLHEGLSSTSDNLRYLSTHWKNVDDEIKGFLQAI